MSEVDGGAPAPADPVVAPAAEAPVDPPRPVSDAPQTTPEAAKPESAEKKAPTTREALAKAAEKVEKEAKEPAPKPAKEPEAKPEAKTEAPRRSEDGKFAAKEPAEGTEKPAQADPAAKAPEAGQKPPTGDDEPPARFTATAKAKWASADPELRAETHRAIRELTGGIEKYRADAEEFGKVRHFAETAKKHGRDLTMALTDMGALEDAFLRHPIEGYEAVARRLGHGTFRQVAEAYLGRSPDQAAAASDAMVREAHGRASQMEAQARHFAGQLQEAQRLIETLMAEKVEALRSAHPRFDELRERAGRALASGFAANEREAFAIARITADAVAENWGGASAPAPEQTPKPQAPAPDPVAQTDRGSRSISGAPSPGSDPVRRTPATSPRDAVRRAFARVGAG